MHSTLAAEEFFRSVLNRAGRWTNVSIRSGEDDRKQDIRNGSITPDNLKHTQS